MNKKIIKKFGYKYFLLGIRKIDGKKVWLQDFSWDCGWYWAGGYVEVFNKSGKDIEEHQHFDSLFLKDPFLEPQKFYFSETPLTRSEWWRLKDLFKQFYVLKEAAEVFQYGGHMSTGERHPCELNEKMANRINKHIEEVIIPQIRKLLSPKLEYNSMTYHKEEK